MSWAEPLWTPPGCVREVALAHPPAQTGCCEGAEPPRRSPGDDYHMTLGIAIANWHHVVQGSDRRLVRGGKGWDDRTNKCVLLACADGVMAITYSGLGYISDLQTDEWIAGVLDANAATKYEMPFAIRVLEEASTEAFRRTPAIDRGAAHAVVLSGWRRVDSGWMPWIAWVANHQIFDPVPDVKDTFHHQVCTPEKGVTEERLGIIIAIGQDRSIPRATWSSMTRRVAGERSATPLTQLLLHAFKEAASRNKAVGKSLMVAILPRPGTGPISTTYQGPERASVTYHPRLLASGFAAGHVRLEGGPITVTAGGHEFILGGPEVPPSGRFRARRPRPRRR